jgi:hypothetical protein
MTAPAWDTISTEITCPLCEYNLRGLTEPRCPECGHQFEWETLTDPRNAEHPFLYEHGKTRRLRRGLQTLRESLVCWRFWEKVPPTVQVRVWRLISYWLRFTLVPFIFWWTAEIGVRLYAFSQQYSRLSARNSTFLSSYPSRWSYLSTRFPYAGWSLGETILLLILWPWITLAVFRIFGATFRQNKIRWRHVARIVVYSGDVLWMMLVPLIILSIYSDLLGRSSRFLWGLFWVGTKELLIGQAMLFMTFVLAVRLCVAARCYLAIPQAVTAAILTQVVYLLLLCVALSWLWQW